MSSEDEARTLRSRVASLQAEVDRLEANCADGNPAMVVSIASTGSAANEFYTCDRLDPGGVEEAGAEPTFGGSDAQIHALNAGNDIPDVGTKVLAHSINSRWVFIFNAPPEEA